MREERRGVRESEGEGGIGREIHERDGLRKGVRGRGNAE
jgi:hypothetical protein